MSVLGRLFLNSRKDKGKDGKTIFICDVQNKYDAKINILYIFRLFVIHTTTRQVKYLFAFFLFFLSNFDETKLQAFFCRLSLFILYLFF